MSVQIPVDVAEEVKAAMVLNDSSRYMFCNAGFGKAANGGGTCWRLMLHLASSRQSFGKPSREHTRPASILPLHLENRPYSYA